MANTDVTRYSDRTLKGAKVRCNSAATGRPLALAYGAARFSGSGSIGSKGVPVKQMQREACKQFPGRVVLVHEFRTSRVSSARTNVVAGQAESFRWLHPVRSMAMRSRIRGLMCSTSNGIRFYDRDVSAALNIARIAAGPGRPRELSSWLGRPAMPNPGRPGQEWVQALNVAVLQEAVDRLGQFQAQARAQLFCRLQQQCQAGPDQLDAALEELCGCAGTLLPDSPEAVLAQYAAHFRHLCSQLAALSSAQAEGAATADLEQQLQEVLQLMTAGGQRLG
ncbi:hypothetical protein QJQ45_017772 [Haematococcus lacustris]|nr:hypothetical protein QJQ45_017772 [Haematococcus lacustris]